METSSISKQEVIKKLTDKGYRAVMEDNVPTLLLDDDKTSVAKLREIFRSEGYYASFKFRFLMGNMDNERRN